MGQGQSAPHQPLDRVGGTRRSLRHGKGDKGTSPRRMDRLRRSFRDSFKRRKEPHVPESSKPHQWQADEAAVRAGTCNFHVKYLGCVEVFESRGMQVCEEALKVLRVQIIELFQSSRRRPVKAILYVSGDGLRVVEDETKGLIVDQTIEKVSFCAPDRNHEKGFSYICRDGTTRRWMCHGFLALKESGERLSHAVGCAFAACLERKQKRDKECGVTMTFDTKNSTFTRTGSFRQASITERLQDPQEVKPTDPPPVKQVFNPHAIERPHATLSMLQRQGSFRGFNQLNQASPFKRQMSLRITDLPSTLERQRSLSLEGSDFRMPPAHLKAPASPQLAVQPYRSRLQSLPASAAYLASMMSPIPESSPLSDRGDSVTAMCQQLAQGLSLLSSTDDFIISTSSQKISNNVEAAANREPYSSNSSTVSITSITAVTTATVSVITSSASSVGGADPGKPNSNSNMWNSNAGNLRVAWCPPVLPPRSTPTPPPPPPPVAPVTPVFPHTELPRPDQWLGNVVSSTTGSSVRRAPSLSHHLRAHSLGSADTFHNVNGTVSLAQRDPFDSEWVSSVPANSTNPFIAPPTAVKAFEVQM